MAYALTRTTGDGSNPTFTIGFTYRAQADVKVYVAGVLQTITTHYTFPSASQITFGTPPANGASVVIRRNTNQTARLVDYAAGSVLKEADLDTDSTQAFNMSQEAIDTAGEAININDSTNQWDATSLRVTNVANPTSDQDAATKHYLENTWLSSTDKTAITTVNSNLTAINAVNNNQSDIDTAAANITAIQNASTNATKAQNYATETDSTVTGTTDDSAKSWAVGGNESDYNMRSAGKGSAKEWATYTTGTANGTEYSSKEYAVGAQRRGQADGGSAKDWATYTGGTVDNSGYSAKYWAQQAATSKTEFSNIYQGALSSDPSGGSVTEGDLYFNTTTNRLKFYDGSSWANIEATDTSSFATKGVAIAMAIAL